MNQATWLLLYWTMLVLGAGASVGTWIGIGIHWRRHHRLVPYEPRRGVPWQFKHVLAIVLVFESPMFFGLLSAAFGHTWADGGSATTSPPAAFHAIGVQDLGGSAAGGNRSGASDQPPIEEFYRAARRAFDETFGDSSPPEQRDTYHPVFDLLRRDGSAGTWLLCIVVVVVVAPITEELVFRLALQGWLAKKERAWRRRAAALRRVSPGWIPVAAVALWFASQHARGAEQPLDPEVLRNLLAVTGAFGVVTALFAISILVASGGASLRDLGLVPERLGSDVRLGMVAFLAVGPPVMALQDVLGRFVLPETVAPDPIPLFVLALALGGLYYRTGRIVPSIVLHMMLNAVSLLLAWVAIGAGVMANIDVSLWLVP